MKFKSLSIILLSSIIVFLNSCLGTTTDTTVVSDDASFASLTFAANDSIPYLSTAAFTLGLDGKTIVNLDSLPFSTRIDSVFPTFSFTTSSAAFLFNLDTPENDSTYISGKDTVDFRINYKVRNYATNQVSFKDYFVKVNVHKVKPELYVWNKVSDNLDSHTALSQKAIILNDTILYYVNDGTNTYLNKSIDGNSWNTPSLNNFPAITTLNDMIQFNGKLYLTQKDNNIYFSSNGIDWSVKLIPDYTFKSLICTLNTKLCAVMESNTNNKLYFASSSDGMLWEVFTNSEIPNNFPVSDFAALSFSSRTGKAKAIVIGGKDANGLTLRTNWNTENGTYWRDYSEDSKSLDSLLIGASVIAYDNKLLLFGNGINAKKPNHFRESIDEGFTWQTPDTLKNRLPILYTTRSYQSVVVYKPSTLTGVQPDGMKQQILESNQIFIFGGKAGTTVLSDVWIGKLNRKSFLRQ